METARQITSLEEAKKYIAERYIFNQQNYPLLKKLDPIESKVFSVTHSLLHIQKNLGWFVLMVDKKLLNEEADSPSFNEKLITVYVKMLINVIKLSEIVDVTLPSYEYPPEEKYVFLVLDSIARIAEQCEHFDHEGVFNIGKVQSGIHDLWTQLLSILKHKNFNFDVSYLLSKIPEYMKSK